MDAKSLIDQYLQEAKIMQLATVDEGKPWVCTVNFAVDDNHNLYWMSLRSTSHSKQVVKYPFVAGAIVVNSENKQGIQFAGTAEEVKGNELEKANEVYEKKYGHKSDRLEEAKSGDENLRTYYKVTPEKFVLFDHVNFSNQTQEVVL